MDIELPLDFKEFLKLLNDSGVVIEIYECAKPNQATQQFGF